MGILHPHATSSSCLATPARTLTAAAVTWGTGCGFSTLTKHLLRGACLVHAGMPPRAGPAPLPRSYPRGRPAGDGRQGQGGRRFGGCGDTLGGPLPVGGGDPGELLGEAAQGKREAQEAPGAPGAIRTLRKTGEPLQGLKQDWSQRGPGSPSVGEFTSCRGQAGPGWQGRLLWGQGAPPSSMCDCPGPRLAPSGSQ